MFIHLRVCLSALFVIFVVATWPAHSSPFENPLDSKVAPAPASAPASSPAQPTCLPRPGNSVATGQRWVYHREGQRKCWFQIAEQSQPKKHVQYRPAKPIVAASPEKGTLQREPKKAEDARAEILSVPQTQPSAPRIEVAAAAPGQSIEPASQLTSEQGRQAPDSTAELRVDATAALTNALQADASSTSLYAAASPVHSISEEPDDKPGWPATSIAMLLMTLGFGSILGSSRVVRDLVMFRNKGARA